MSDIYEQHRNAFNAVAAYVILKNGERVATIAFKYPRDGAGRLFAYVHWIGNQMVRGYAAGGGYDKHSAACAAAVRRMADKPLDLGDFDAFRRELAKDDGYYWNQRLEKAGFTVLQAV